MTDLSQSFNNLVASAYESILGCLVEKLPDGRFRWRDTIGTREQVEKAILDASANIQNSINKQHGEEKI